MVDLRIELPSGFLEEEVRCGYTVSAEMKKLWAVELDLLAETDRICRKHGIQYFAQGGTLLGAIRHKGFIPWDDDIDLYMTWENYKHFREIAPGELKYPYAYQDGYTETASVRGHIQIRNSATTAIRRSEMGKAYPFNQGVFIDIFPLDAVPDNAAERKAFIEGIRKRRLRTVKVSRLGRRYTPAVRQKTKGIKRIGKDLLHALIIGLKIDEKTFRDYETFLHRYNDRDCRQWGNLCFLKLVDKLIWDADEFRAGLIEVPFEFIQMPVPERYESILSTQYGKWQEFVVGTSVHGELFVDTDHPYTKYLHG